MHARCDRTAERCGGTALPTFGLGCRDLGTVVGSGLWAVDPTHCVPLSSPGSGVPFYKH